MRTCSLAQSVVTGEAWQEASAFYDIDHSFADTAMSKSLLPLVLDALSVLQVLPEPDGFVIPPSHDRQPLSVQTAVGRHVAGTASSCVRWPPCRGRSVQQHHNTGIARGDADTSSLCTQQIWTKLRGCNSRESSLQVRTRYSCNRSHTMFSHDMGDGVAVDRRERTGG